MPRYRIAQARPDQPEALALIARHLQQMAEQSPEDSCHAMDSSGLAGPDVAFFLLWQGEQAVGMGALKTLGSAGAELKSMHVLPETRGTGAGRMMLEHLLELARTNGAGAVYLETGSTDDFLAARRLYESYGFTTCEPFGDYTHDPWSVFMVLELSPTA